MINPAQIIKELRQIAMECEEGERSPLTGKSTWLKEETIEWMAADLLEARKQEIDNYEKLHYAVHNALEDFRNLDERNAKAFRVKLRRK